MIYLASPYSDPDPAVREARFQATCKATAEIIRYGFDVLSPIVCYHSLVQYGLPTGQHFWSNVNWTFLGVCDEMWALMLDGWDKSKGVEAEIKMAQELKKRVFFMPPESITKTITLYLKGSGDAEMPSLQR